jgi:hypothetical protein
VRRWAVDPDELAFYVAYGPEATTEAELVRVCGRRWQVEEGLRVQIKSAEHFAAGRGTPGGGDRMAQENGPGAVWGRGRRKESRAAGQVGTVGRGYVEDY